MENRKYFVALSLAVAFILTPVFANAQTPTVAELQAQIAALQRQLAILLGQQDNTGTWCHTFNTNLSIGMTGSEVVALQTALARAGFSVNDSEGGNFNESTAAAVSGFQLRYQSEILTPLGLIAPTGYFGPSTRAVMNQLYGCGNTTMPPPPTATPALTVTSPSSNQQWTSTNGPVIQWSSSNIPSGNTVTVELLTSSNGSVPGFSSFTTANDGSESGRLTNSSVASGSYYFRLSTVVNGQTIYGGSGVFQFTGVAPTVTLRGFQLRVTDQTTSAGLAGVTVTINRGGTYVATQTTGSDGWTPAISLRVGESHTFSFSKTGYQNTSAISLTIPSGSGTYTYGPVRLTATTTTLPATYTLTTTVPGGNGAITKSPNQTSYNSGTVVTLTATPVSGYTFIRWFGNLTGGANPTTITMNGNKSVSAYFEAAPLATPSLTVTSPSNNQQWTSTNGPVIQWSSANIPSGNQITVELLTSSNGQVSGFSSFTTANDGSESGRLTNSSVASGWYYFRLSTVVNGQTIYGGSGVFQFTGATAPPTSVCGNGILDSGEQCDGSNFGGLSCTTYNYSGGSLSCSASCTLSTSQCTNQPAAASINISSPTASSRWTPTAFTHSVTWASSNIPSSQFLTMELMTPANTRVNAFTPVSSVNDGSQAVNISNITPGYYWFRLTATVNGQTIYGGSPVFQIVSS